MDKNDKSPLTKSEDRLIENLNKFQQKVNELTRDKEPEYVKGTIEPPVKK